MLIQLCVFEIWSMLIRVFLDHFKPLYDISPCDYITILLSIYKCAPVHASLGTFQFFTISNRAVMNVPLHVSCAHVKLSLGWICSVNHGVQHRPPYNPNPLTKEVLPVLTCAGSAEDCQCSPFLPNWYRFKIFASLTHVKWYLTPILICISSITSEVGQLFTPTGHLGLLNWPISIPR